MKELIQMRRDKMTFAFMFAIPVMQLVIFGFAINSNPKHLPTAIVAEEQTPIVRTLIHAMSHSQYFDLQYNELNHDKAEQLLAEGKVAFVLIIPKGFSENLIRGERPELLVEADASDPSASSGAISFLNTILNQALAEELKGSLSYLQNTPSAFSIVVHPKYNPEGITQYNIVPGLLGVIITMTMVMITSMAMTRETEQGTMENLLAMPAKPIEVMIGKITPYVGVGAVQTLVVLVAAKLLFDVPFVGSITFLALCVSIFILANLCLGFTFSTIAKSQMQAMQLTFFFFLPSILLSGFMFPYRGMPVWAQTIGEVLPLTHFLRIIRGIMLKGSGFAQVQNEMLALGVFILVVGTVAILRYKRTLD
ncbi:ABC transporter permease [Marinicellulosiphila megalodicopiae]|uniref:ABC transporter permease n=1 Tax=Marinicellulosiphila megalodicopiae TaxID=2724896 RepID=UPI003BB141F3